jgi:hypothetical protein
MLAFAQGEATSDASPQRIERHAVEGKQAIGAGIIANAATRTKLRAVPRLRWGWDRSPGGSSSLYICAPAGQALGILGLDCFDGLHRLRAGADRQLRAQPKASAGLPIDAVMRCVGVGDALIPTHGGNPGCRGIELLLRLGQCGLIPVYVQLDADSSREHFIHRRNIVQMF